MGRARAESERGERERRRRQSLRELRAIRQPVLEETRERSRDPSYLRGKPAHLCCTRALNSMRISPLEAQAIGEAFRSDPELRRHLTAVLRRLRDAARGLRDTEERQNFDCPLLDGTRCLVHDVAKPIGCAAWHPPEDGEDARFSRTAWNAFAARDRLNDACFGPDWKLRVIPLALKRIFARELERLSQRESSTPPAGEGESSGAKTGAPSERPAGGATTSSPPRPSDASSRRSHGRRSARPAPGGRQPRASDPSTERGDAPSKRKREEAGRRDARSDSGRKNADNGCGGGAGGGSLRGDKRRATKDVYSRARDAGEAHPSGKTRRAKSERRKPWR